MNRKTSERPGSVVGADTRARLISTAVRHFARDGFGAASQRAIQREAGVNAASAHYHFGSKAALYRAVIENFIHDVQEDRVRRHAALPPNLTGADRLERLLYDYFYPGLRIAADREGYHYALILSRLQGEVSGEANKIFLDAVRPVRQLYLASLAGLFPHVEREILEPTLATGVTLMATTPVRFTPDFDDPERYAACHAGTLAKGLAAAMAALYGNPVG